MNREDLDGLPPRTWSAQQLNVEAGTHAVTDDPRELAAALRAGERSWLAAPYYELRYGERGRRFTRSDSGWLVTLASSPQSYADAQVAWLARVLASRGMPRLLLERHLLVLRDELAAAVPAQAASYEVLAQAARRLGDDRRRWVDDEQLAALASEFDASVQGEAGLPGAGELVVAAVTDERQGVSGAVPSLLAWLADEQRFSPAWCQAVHALTDRVRALTSGPAKA